MRRAVAVALLAALALPACFGGGDEEAPHVAVGFLRAVAGQDLSPVLDELRRAGFVEGRNLTLFAKDDDEVHPDPADAERVVGEWVEEGLDVVVAFSSTGAAAASRAAPDADILCLTNDPVAVGLLENEERPEGRLTGVTFRVPADRTLALLRQALPGLAVLGFLEPEGDPAAVPHRIAAEAAAEDANIDLLVEAFAADAAVGAAVDALVDAGAEAILVANAPTAVMAMARIEGAARRRSVALVANSPRAPDAVLVVTPDVAELQAQLGRQAVRLLNGAEPSDVPVEDPRRFRVTINALRAEELGIGPLPGDLLRQADDVIGADTGDVRSASESAGG